MTDRIVENEQQRKALVTFIEQHKLPLVATIKSGRHRTLAQNKLQRQWMNELAEQMEDITGQTAEEWRAYCKLNLGVLILREEDEKFRAEYDRVIKPLPYETKLSFMGEPFDFPVTRLMTTKQKHRYLESVIKFAGSIGVSLTQPDDGLMASLQDAA